MKFTIMRGLSYTIIGLLFFVQSPTLAQDASSTPVPWPPDPKTLFTEYVTVVDDQLPVKPTNTPLEPTPSKCGEPIERYYSDSNWHYYVDPQTKAMRFCEATTGKLTNPLPGNISFWTEVQPNPSPDNEWLTFWEIEENSNGGIYESYTLYSFQIASEKIRLLGTIPYDGVRDDIRVSGWMDNRHGAAVQSGGPEVYGTTVFAFDVESENSLQATMVSVWPDFNDNPPRYEFLETKQFLQWKTGSIVSVDIPCTLSIYDKYGYHVHNLAKACLPLSISNPIGEDQYEYTTHVGNLYFFKPFDETDKKFTQKISSIDVSNGEVRDVFYGQADLLSVSPDGKYFILVIDHSILALYNISNQHVIFAAENPDEQYNRLGISYVVRWLDDNQVMIYSSPKESHVTLSTSGDMYLIGLPASLRLIRINADESTRVLSTYDDQMSEPQDISPNSKYVLTEDSLYNFVTNAHYRILTDSARQYNVILKWIDNTHINALVYFGDKYKAFTLVFDESY